MDTQSTHTTMAEVPAAAKGDRDDARLTRLTKQNTVKEVREEERRGLACREPPVRPLFPPAPSLPAALAPGVARVGAGVAAAAANATVAPPAAAAVRRPCDESRTAPLRARP